jgi:hypothetical protein
MRTLAVLLFIAAAAGVAAYLAQRPTIADGRVMEAELLAQLREAGVTGLACDREIPIGLAGAVFTCVASLRDGTTQTVEYAMNRAGDLRAKVTPAAPGRIPPSGDPWSN